MKLSGDDDGSDLKWHGMWTMLILFSLLFTNGCGGKELSIYGHWLKAAYQYDMRKESDG